MEKSYLFEINFHLYRHALSWSATIHQLNSDILKRHILPRLDHASVDLDFSFCERTHTGQILCSQGAPLGTFAIPTWQQA
ncbi:hypothetical protein VST7929_02770 [Vibrio stylophorae]|uniref:Uncharacterized protein n=1 Tax=Vibrio stylophorae TaxID=659351 RepID=A0ABM8ZWT6_9VIBR|nr:hypothetical protein [Vibrio stylophorae]CAH0535109.1 hypothetical protein VST7929_02770 [Vibrio stylophorae]